MDTLTPDDVLHWDVSAIQQMFASAGKIAATNQNLGDALANARQLTADWHGEAGDAFHEELGRHRTDIDADGHESQRVAKAIQQAEDDVRYCHSTMVDIDETARGNGWVITPNWIVDDSGDTRRIHDPQLLQNSLTMLKVRAETADHELAVAVRAAVGDAQVDEQGHETVPNKPTPNTVPGPHQGDPGYQTGQKPTLAGDPGDNPPMQVAPGSSDSVTLADNPPGYNGGPGPARDQAWQSYLSQQSGTTSGKVGPATVLPNPDAVSDPGLKTVGAAAKQQGVSYAWGGGHVPGKTGVSPGWAEDGDRSATFNDGGRTGFDCAGLARFSTAQGHNGLDISKGNIGNTVGQYSSLTAPGGAGTPVSDAALKPGDLIYFGPPGASEHVAVYAGNGLVVQAHQSGEPVEVSPFDVNWQHRSVHVEN